MGHTVKFYCIITNNGDGSAGALFYPDKETAQLAYDVEQSNGEAFTDNEPVKVILKFNDKGRLLNQDPIPDDYRNVDE